jgi:tetratricopeptide (TPR) repeat protein
LGDHVTGGTRFADVSSAVGLDLIDDARGMALVDWDQDGDLDVWLANRTGPRARFMLNQINPSPSYLSLQLQGTQCNRDAIGARVELVLKDKQTRIKTLRAGEGFLSQNSKFVHFGLATGETIEEIRIRWPGNDTPEVFQDVHSGGRYSLVEGSHSAQRMADRAHVKFNDVSFDMPPGTDRSRIVLTQRRPMPMVEWTDLAGKRQTFDITTGSTLINLWASWCDPCIAELSDLKQNANRLKEQGITILALSVDSEIAEAQSSARKLDLPFDVGMATQSLLESLTILDHEIFYRERPLPLPCSFLVDSKGQLSIIYKGSVATQQIASDVPLLDAPLAKLADAAQPFPGLRVASWFAPGHVNVARAYLDGGYIDDAKRELQHELQLPAESADHVRALQMLSDIAASEKDTRLQISMLKALQKLDPENLQVQLQQVVVMAATGYSEESLQQLSEIAAQASVEPKDLVMIAQAYGRIGETQQAISLLERAIEVDPNHVESRLSLAIARQLTGEIEAAIAEYRKVLVANPSHLDAANNLAWLLATETPEAPNYGEAVELARRVCNQTKYSNPAYLDTLAVVLLSQGAIDDAVEVLKQAIPLAKGRGEFELMQKMAARLVELAK